ncbi:phosphotransferase [Maricaulis sp.]|uniref:aminoglycoside phosphotransferase family protein n=1 Tax=Maricaulis sp. TaxID=1486257 RepID=UPI00260FE7DB|nr:phosphotransferase [Maricaulis sp.]
MSRSDRDTALDAFLDSAGWGGAEHHPLAGDASTRRYVRLRDGEHSAMLMDAPGAAEAPACPPGATPKERLELGYNAAARLAGPNLAAFTGLANVLNERGFSAPRILASDFEHGYLLLEDLGDELLARLLPGKLHEGTVYARAVDTLAAIHRCSFPAVLEADGHEWPLQAYDATALMAEANLFVEWYLERHAGIELSGAAQAEWSELWTHAFQRLDACPSGLVLRDYHAENLVYLPDREGEAAIGLLDFQDALIGHPAYDLVSLLEDARRNVDRKLAIPLKARFVEQAGIQDPAGFDAAYAVLGAQRNAKILGIFVRLAVRDGKQRYLDMLPRVARHFVADLQHPALMPLNMWAKTHAQRVFLDAHK